VDGEPLELVGFERCVRGDADEGGVFEGAIGRGSGGGSGFAGWLLEERVHGGGPAFERVGDREVVARLVAAGAGEAFAGAGVEDGADGVGDDERAHDVPAGPEEAGGAEATFHGALGAEELRDGGSGASPDGALGDGATTGADGGQVALLGAGEGERVADGEVEDDSGGHDRDLALRRRDADVALGAPAHDAIGGGEAEGASAGEDDGVAGADEVGEGEDIGFAGAGGAPAGVDGGGVGGGAKDDGAAGGGAAVAVVTDADAGDIGDGVAGAGPPGARAQEGGLPAVLRALT
jgi:hypothetical protein